MKNKKVLFLNPPGKEIYIRDYYCSKVSKAYYLPHPVDLLMQTGHFASRGYDISIIDAIVDRLNVSITINKVREINPDLIISQCGSVSFTEDNLFFTEIKKILNETKILSSGDLFLEDPGYFLENYAWLDGIIINWFCDGSLNYFEGNYDIATGLVFKKNNEIRAISKKTEGKYVSIPRPKHELFFNKKYRYAYVTHYPMATVLTNYGCPFPCSFCIMPKLGFLVRKPEDVIDEIKFLKNNGIRYIYFSDQTFYAHPQATDAILDFMIEEKIDIEWCCFTRVDRVDEKRLKKMKKAGCNVIMFGVEFAEDELLNRYKKNYSLEQVRETFRLAKDIGLKRMGTFLIGLPGQTEESIRKTLNLAIKLEADYASFNVAVPRAQTSFREEALSKKLIMGNDRIMDQSGSFITMGTGVLSAEDIYRLKNEAYCKFYFRLDYLLKRLLKIRTMDEFKTHFIEAFYILKGILSKEKTKGATR
ncbi:MAG: radical SAM protein [Candidatus Hydrogenedentota bacterium]